MVAKSRNAISNITIPISVKPYRPTHSPHPFVLI
jgi:hypothetical protein